MKIFVPRDCTLTDCLDERLAEDGYTEIVMDDRGKDLGEAIVSLLVCDAILLPDRATEASGVEKLYRDIAAECGISVVRCAGYKMSDAVLNAACRVAGISRAMLVSRCRKTGVVRARMAAASILFDYGLSVMSIGRLLHVDRATAYYYVRRAKELLDCDKEFRILYDKIFNM